MAVGDLVTLADVASAHPFAGQLMAMPKWIQHENARKGQRAGHRDLRTNSTIVSSAVALAAIQELNDKVSAQQRQIAELSERVQKAEAQAADVAVLHCPAAVLPTKEVRPSLLHN